MTRTSRYRCWRRKRSDIPYLPVAVMQGLGALASLGAQVVLSHVMALAAYGVYATVLATVQLLGFPATAGLEVTSIYFIAGARSRWEQMAFMRFALRMMTSLCLVIGAGVLAYTFVDPGRFNSALQVGALFLFTYALLQVSAGLVRGVHLVIRASFGWALLEPLFVAVGGGLVWFLRSQQLVPAAVAVLLEAASSGLIALWLLGTARARIRSGRAVGLARRASRPTDPLPVSEPLTAFEQHPDVAQPVGASRAQTWPVEDVPRSGVPPIEQIDSWKPVDNRGPVTSQMRAVPNRLAMKRRRPHQFDAVDHVGSTSSRQVWLKASVNLALFGSFALILAEIDTVIVSAISGARDAGIYAAAWKLSNIVGFALFTVQYGTSGRIAQLWSGGQRDELQSVLRKSSRIVVPVSLAACGGIAVLGQPILETFYGSAFGRAYGVLILLSLSMLANAVT
nr:MATE family efflux transporter [Actinomycetota bacterium]